MAAAGADFRGVKFPLTIPQGADVAFALRVTSRGVAVDMSSATVTGEIYASKLKAVSPTNKGGTVAATFASAISGAPSNIVTLSLTDVQTAALVATDNRWTLWVTRGGDIKPWLTGKVNVTGNGSGGKATSGTFDVEVDGDIMVNVDVAVIGAPGGGSSTLDGLTDVTITTPANGQALTWNGSEWVNSTPSGSGDMLSTANLSDVADVPTARTNLGLGTAALAATGDFDAAGAAAAAQAASQPLDADLTALAAAGNSATLAATTAAFTTTKDSKLTGIESGATADQTAAELLTAIKTVDGTGSGLDADLLDGVEASGFATAAHDHTGVYQPLDSDLTALAAAGNSATLASTDAVYNTTKDGKLSGIEALADVTDAANVAAAGAVMALSTVTKINGPITQAAYDLLTPDTDTLYVIVG